MLNEPMFYFLDDGFFLLKAGLAAIASSSTALAFVLWVAGCFHQDVCKLSR